MFYFGLSYNCWVFNVIGFHPILNICVDVSVLLLGGITAVRGDGITGLQRLWWRMSALAVYLTAGFVCISFLTQFRGCTLRVPPPPSMTVLLGKLVHI